MEKGYPEFTMKGTSFYGKPTNGKLKKTERPMSATPPVGDSPVKGIFDSLKLKDVLSGGVTKLF